MVEYVFHGTDRKVHIYKEKIKRDKRAGNTLEKKKEIRVLS